MTSVDVSIEPERLNAINEGKDTARWNNELGGVKKVAAALNSDPKHGLKSADVEKNRQLYGKNAFKEREGKTFIGILLEALKDPTLILLMAAATVSTVLGAAIAEEREHNAWVEGVAIWVAVILVSMVASVNDYQKELQFKKLNAAKDIIQVSVVRDGEQQLIANTDVVVGDVLLLDTGDKVIADGVEIEGHHLVIDEASLTGESDPIKKQPDGDFWCRSGSQVTDGDARVLITAVGPNSEWGMIMDKVQGESEEETPLQEKLGYVASAIAKIGTAVAICAFIVLLIRWIVANKGFPWSQFNNNGPLQFFLYAVTIIVVAVPEGLPLAVTISLAYSMKKMMRDNNFVRHLAACETMGGATAICSDKTGTLTENRMTVVEGWFAGKRYTSPPRKDQLPPAVADDIIKNICTNSKAWYKEEPGKKVEFVGNRTECALLQLCQKEFGVPYDSVRQEWNDRVVQFYGFSSAKKMASVLLDQGDGTLRLYNKGASEWVLDKSVAVAEADGSVVELTAARKQALMDTVTEMATRGLRTLVLTYTDFKKDDPSRPANFFADPPDRDLVVTCIVGIKDPVRKEVPGAVRTCTRAGIVVRMVTGDNIHTAQHIARECGILTEDGFAIEGPDFRATPREEMIKRVHKLQVMARSSPTDKHTLVNMLREQGEVVAVTGDGTNDAPALKESDVGLAMGISGTEVAKEAADIVILDDNFKSIVLAVLWGRSVFNNIRKFLQFQLTINIVALVVAFIGAFVQKEPLNVLQLLWVNLIMDTLAALALATEDPHVSLLAHKPHGREAPLINGTMWKHMTVQALYQIFWMLLILFGAPKVFDRYYIRSECQVFNQKDFCGSGTVRDLEMERNSPAQINDPETVCRDYAFYVAPGDNCPSFDEPSVNELRQRGGYAQNACTGDDPCPELQSNVDTVFEAWDNAHGFFNKEKEHDEETSKSLLFNAFIFMQVFNEINSRKILDEYNVFAGMQRSPIFIVVLIVTVGLQVIIVQTPLAGIFHVTGLNGWEWLVSILIGLGVLPLSFLTRLVSRVIFKQNIPAPNADHVDMDIGYGAVVNHKAIEQEPDGETGSLLSNGADSGKRDMKAANGNAADIADGNVRPSEELRIPSGKS